MKLINWNCNGAFRNKKYLFDEYEYDILIIQECEDPSKLKEYENSDHNYLWIGNNKNKGLGIFCKNNISLKRLDWSDINIKYKNEQLESFLPCLINDEIIIIGVWTKKANSEVFGYIGQFWKYLQLHKDKLIDKKVIIVGDFNSNAIWDKWDRWWNHTNVVDELDQVGIKSLYHIINNEEQGKETKPTFYLQRKLEKPYHIDYIFLSNNLISDFIEIKIGEIEKWLNYSDHLPIFSNV